MCIRDRVTSIPFHHQIFRHRRHSGRRCHESFRINRGEMSRSLHTPRRAFFWTRVFNGPINPIIMFNTLNFVDYRGSDRPSRQSPRVPRLGLNRAWFVLVPWGYRSKLSKVEPSTHWHDWFHRGLRCFFKRYTQPCQTHIPVRQLKLPVLHEAKLM